jgi:putative ABC transport system permease protein
LDKEAIPFARTGVRGHFASDFFYPKLQTVKLMLRIFVVTAFRNLKRGIVLSSIKITGLAIGMLCFIITIVFYQHELSYDEFPDADNVYRYVHRVNLPEGMEEYAFTSAMTGPAIRDRFSTVQSFCRLLLQPMTVRAENQEAGLNEDRFVFADSTFEKFFPFTLSSGKAGTLLKDPFTVVISPRAAKKYFGDENPLGKLLLTNDETAFRVTGVYAENNSRTHLGTLDFIASFASLEPMGKKPGWANRMPATTKLDAKGFNSFYTYFLLSPGTSPHELTDKFPAFIEEFRGEGKSERLKPTLQALKDIHLHSGLKYEIDVNGDSRIPLVLLIIGSIILVISNINFVNISISEFIRRSRGVGIQKVLGTSKAVLISSYLTEVFLLALVSGVISISFLYGLLPFVNRLIGRDMVLDLSQAAFLLLVISVGSTLLSGLYPAIHVSRVRAVEVIRSRFSMGKSVGNTRNVLLLLQLSISFALVAGTLIIYSQLDYLLQKDLGYDTSNVLQINTVGTTSQVLKTFKEQLSETRAVGAVASSSTAYGQTGFSFGIRLPESGDEERTYGVIAIIVDSDYLQALQLKLLNGRFFQRDIATDTIDNVVINETAAGLLFDGDAIGKKIMLPSGGLTGSKVVTVIGVVADYNHASLRQRIEPLILQFDPSRFNYLLVKYDLKDLHAVVSALDRKWRTFFPDKLFEYIALDESGKQIYKDEKSLGDLIAVFSVVAVGIATIGLFGVGLFIVQQKTREYGIRKVLGATTRSIYLGFGKPIFILLFIAFIISTPVSWYFASRWLSKYPYRTEISLSVYANSFAFIAAIVVVTLLYHLGRMAKVNPVEVLKEQ